MSDIRLKRFSETEKSAGKVCRCLTDENGVLSYVEGDLEEQSNGLYVRVPSTLVYITYSTENGVAGGNLGKGSKSVSRLPLRGYAESAVSSKSWLFCIEERDLTGNGEKHILGFTDFFESKELAPAFDFIFPPELNNIYLS